MGLGIEGKGGEREGEDRKEREGGREGGKEKVRCLLPQEWLPVAAYAINVNKF